MSVTAEFTYYVTFGAGDGSDIFEYRLNLEGEQATAYRKATMLRIPYNEVPELYGLLNRAKEEIKKYEQDNSFDLDSEDVDNWSFYVSYAHDFDWEDLYEDEALKHFAMV